jgi:hypothetical protein
MPATPLLPQRKTTMKKLFLTTIALLLLVTIGRAQGTWQFDLSEVIAHTEAGRDNAYDTKSALHTLAVQYFVLGNPNPNVNAYLTAMDDYMNSLEFMAGEAHIYAEIAFSKNTELDIADILAWTDHIIARVGDVRTQSANLACAIALGNTGAAATANGLLNAYLDEIVGISNDIIFNANYLLSTPTSYTVRITLVDYLGNPVGSNGLQGYYGLDSQNNYIDATNQDGDLFEGLAPGTYTFAAYNGYWDGASSETVTLSPSLINGNGEVVVQLVYWVE